MDYPVRHGSVCWLMRCAGPPDSGCFRTSLSSSYDPLQFQCAATRRIHVRGYKRQIRRYPHSRRRHEALSCLLFVTVWFFRAGLHVLYLPAPASLGASRVHPRPPKIVHSTFIDRDRIDPVDAKVILFLKQFGQGASWCGSSYDYRAARRANS